MASEPSGLLADFGFNSGFAESGGLRFLFTTSGTGTLTTPTDRDIETANGNWSIDRFTWNTSNNLRFITVGGNTPSAIDDVAGDYPNGAFYIWWESNLYSINIVDADSISDTQFRWDTLGRPATLMAGDPIRVLFTSTDIDQDGQISRFLQGLPDNVDSDSVEVTANIGDMTIEWDAATDATSYRVQRSTDQSTWTSRGTSTTTSYTDTGLTGGTTYYYRVRAENSNGNSDYTDGTPSAEAIADTIPNLGTYADQEVEINASFARTLPFSSTGNTPLVYTLTGDLPAGVSFAANTRIIFGTPTETGTFPLTYTVTDADSDTDSLMFDLVVAAAAPDAPDAPLLTAAEDSITATMSDPSESGTGTINQRQYRVKRRIDSTWGSAVTISDSNVPIAFTISSLNEAVRYDVQVRVRNTSDLYSDWSDTAFTSPTQTEPTDGTLFLNSLTTGTDEDARMLITIDESGDILFRRNYTNDANLGEVATDDADLPPEVDRVRFTGGQNLLLNARNDPGSFNSYPNASTHAMFVAYLDSSDDITLWEVDYSDRAAVGGGFVRWTVPSDRRADFTALTDDDRILIVFAESGSIEIAEDALTVGAIDDQNGTYNSAFSVTLPEATGGTSPYSYALTGRPSWASFNTTTRVLSGTPTTAGTSTLTYTVTDDASSSVAIQFDLIIAATAPGVPTGLNENIGLDRIAVGWTAPTDTGGVSLTGMSLQWREGGAGAVSTLSLGPTVVGSTITSLDEDTEYQWRIGAVNSAGTTYSAWRSVTTLADLMPTLAVIPNQTAVFNESYSYTLPTATGGDTPITYSISGLPSWASFSSSTRVLSGTPDTDGSWTLTYTATDDDGDEAEREFDVTVATAVPAAPGAPTLSVGDGELSGSMSDPSDTGTGDIDQRQYRVRTSALSDPDGLFLNFSFTAGASTGSGNRNFLYSNFGTFSGNTGSGLTGDNSLEIPNQGTMVFDQVSWNTASVGAFTGGFSPARLALADVGNSIGDSVASELPDDSLYIVAEGTAYEFPFADALNIANDNFGWNTEWRPSDVGSGDTIYILAAESGQRQYVEDFITAGDAGTWGSAVTITDTSAPIEFTIPSLTNGTSYDVQVRVRNDDNLYSDWSTFASETPDEVDLTPALAVIDDQNATENQSFSVTLPTATGGNTPITYALTGTLPAGVTFVSSTRVLSGTPTEDGTFSLTYTATDDDGDEAERDFDLIVAADLMPTLAAINDQAATENTAYSFTLPTATGGDTPITYSLTGTLPAGVTFTASTRILAGTPTESGTFSFTYTATDDDGDEAEREFDLVISSDLTPSLAVIDDQTATRNVEYSFTLPTATGGDTPITYSLTGDLPTGITFTAGTRVLAGTPTETGIFSLTYTATDDDGDEAERDFDLAVANSLPVLDAVDDQEATVGEEFELTLDEASGFDTPFDYEVSGLPPWLSFDATTRTLSGTPETAPLWAANLSIDDDSVDVGNVFPLHAEDGVDGYSSFLAFTRSENEPDAPDASDFEASDGAIDTYPTDWGDAPPDGDDPAWVVIVRVQESTVTVIDAVTLFTQEASGAEGQSGIRAGNDRVNHILFRRSSTKPSNPTVIFDDRGYVPIITESSVWQLTDPDPDSADSLWVAYAQSTYYSSEDVWALTTWVVVLADDGFDLQFSHSESSDNPTWHDPPLHGSSHSTPDNWMRFRDSDTGNFSPPIRVRDAPSELPWTGISGQIYIDTTSNSAVISRGFTEMQLNQFTELMIRVHWFGGYASAPVYITNPRRYVHGIIPIELSNGWKLAPSNFSGGTFQSAYTYRVLANADEGVSIAFNNDRSGSGDSKRVQITFFMALRRSNNLSGTGENTKANRVLLWGHTTSYQKGLMRIYGR